MAKILPAPEAFPGQQGQRDHGSTGYSVPSDSAVAASITPGGNDADMGGQLSTNIFPGARGSQPGGGSGSGGASGSGADDVIQTTRPSGSGSTVGAYRQLSAPNIFPGGDQIPSGVEDSTGTTGPRRLRADNSGGVMP